MKQWFDEQGRRVTQFEPDDVPRMEALIAELERLGCGIRPPSAEAREWARRRAKELGLT